MYVTLLRIILFAQTLNFCIEYKYKLKNAQNFLYSKHDSQTKIEDRHSLT